MEKRITNLKIVVVATLMMLCSRGMQCLAQSSVTSVGENAELQLYAEELMTCKSGALVAVVPSTGEVLCVVSTSEQQKGAFGCDICRSTVMGSAFNMAMVLGCLQDSIISPETKLPCNRIVWSLDKSMATSCNGYFEECREMFLHSTRYKNPDAASTRMREVIMSMGFGKEITSDSGEIVAIPREMANFAAIIANRGHYPTSLVDKGDKGCKALIDSMHFEAVIRGMRKAAEVGTVWRAGNMDPEGIELCGVTGSIQNPQGNNLTAFMGFAPMNNPEIAIYCVIENDDTGSILSIPIATLVIEKYINGHISERRKWMADKVK